MLHPMKRAFILAPILLAACGSDGDPGPGGVTVGEAEALDEAAAMIEQGRPELPSDQTDNEPASQAESETDG